MPARLSARLSYGPTCNYIISVDDAGFSTSLRSSIRSRQEYLGCVYVQMWRIMLVNLIFQKIYRFINERFINVLDALEYVVCAGDARRPYLYNVRKIAALILALSDPNACMRLLSFKNSWKKTYTMQNVSVNFEPPYGDKNTDERKWNLTLICRITGGAENQNAK